MNEQRMQFAIGMVTIIAGFALAAIIIWFGEFQFVLQPRKIYYITLKEGLGAEPKVPVRRAGIRIGEIRKVEYSEENSLVILTIVIEGDNDLREGDEPTLKRSFLGDTYLDIETRADLRGVKNRKIIPSESTIEGRSPIDVGETLATASEVIPTANETLVLIQKASKEWTSVGQKTNKLLDTNEKKITSILDQTVESMDRLSSTLESINSVLDAKSQENVKVTLENVRKASGDFQPTIDATRKAIEQINQTTSRLDEVAHNLQEATKPLAQRSESTLKNLEKTTENLSALVEDLRAMNQRFQAQDGTLQRLIRDPSLYQNLDDAAYTLTKNLALLGPILEDMKVFADKIARHPGELGVQGVLTKDAGLKNVEPGTLDVRKKPFLRKAP